MVLLSKQSETEPMIKWIACKDRMPSERGDHLLYSETADRCFGPIPWIPDDNKGGIWCDLFATPEAGEAYTPGNGVTHWAEWNGPEKP